MQDTFWFCGSVLHWFHHDISYLVQITLIRFKEWGGYSPVYNESFLVISAKDRLVDQIEELGCEKGATQLDSRVRMFEFLNKRHGCLAGV